MKIQIQNNKIIWDNNSDDEPNTINEVRDYAEKYFYKEIKSGYSLVFNEWNYNQKEINYTLI